MITNMHICIYIYRYIKYKCMYLPRCIVYIDIWYNVTITYGNVCVLCHRKQIGSRDLRLLQAKRNSGRANAFHSQCKLWTGWNERDDQTNITASCHPTQNLKNPLATSSHYYWWVNKNPAPLDRQFIPLFAGKTHPRWLFGISSINSINDKHKMFQDALLLVVAPPRSLISWVHTDEALPLHTTCRSQVWHVNISDICDLYIYIYRSNMV